MKKQLINIISIIIVIISQW